MNGPFTLTQLEKVLSAQLVGADLSIDGVSTDTRNINAGDLFVALKGENFDAHHFIEKAADSGAIAVVVEHRVDTDLPQLIVEDARLALGTIAQFNRDQFKGSLFAITGSSGKTTVKEMLAAINAVRGKTLATIGNLNNDIGVPLTLLRLSEGDRYAVIEMGASGPHEIAYSTGLARPDVALLNNALGAHLEGFGSLQGVVDAKAEIFSGLTAQGTAVVNLDDPHSSVWLDMLQQQPVLTFSVDTASGAPAADVFATDIQLQNSGCYRFNLNYKQHKQQVALPLIGRHNVANALAAATAAIADGCELATVATGLANCRAVAGRMKPFQLDPGTLLIDDSYNANPSAVKVAIDAVTDLNGEAVLVLGDMAELGSDEVEQHRDVGRYAAAKGVKRLFTCGKLCNAAVEGFLEAGGSEAMHLESRDALVAHLSQLSASQLGKQRNILVKGSRSAAMDQVVNGLINGEAC